MANKKFTKEEMDKLRECPYVLKVTPSIVHFSADFKQQFWDALFTGEHPRDVVASLGIDPDILGTNRIFGLRGMIQKELKSGKGLRDLNTYGEYLEGYASPEVMIKHLEQQLAYKTQEVEYLKKIVSLGRKGAGS